MFFYTTGFEKVSKSVVGLTIDFSWDGMSPYGWRNPKIIINNLPAQTKFIKLHMYEHYYHWDHGKGTFPYTGSSIIEKDRFPEIQ